MSRLSEVIIRAEEEAKFFIERKITADDMIEFLHNQNFYRVTFRLGAEERVSAWFEGNEVTLYPAPNIFEPDPEKFTVRDHTRLMRRSGAIR